MAQSGYTPIVLFHSTTPSAQPLAADLAAGELALNIVDGKLYYKDANSAVQLLANGGAESHLTWDATNNTLIVNATGSLQVAKGTTAQRPATPDLGDIRYNTTTKGFEGYQTLNGAVLSSLTNTTTTATATTGSNAGPLGDVGVDRCLLVLGSHLWVVRTGKHRGSIVETKVRADLRHHALGFENEVLKADDQ